MTDYRTHVFDCDGVLLDSNPGKAEAFYQTALPYGEDAARQMLEFHRAAGNLSRRERWEHFVSLILQRDPREGEIDELMRTCQAHVMAAVRQAEKMPGVEEYLESLDGALLYVVSGVETAELELVLREHGLAGHFTGIYGGPRPKRELLPELVASGAIEQPAVYYGDAEDDYRAAQAAGMRFVFVRGGSEIEDWQETFRGCDIDVLRDFEDDEMTVPPPRRTPSPEPLPATTARRMVRVRVNGKGEAYVDGKRVYVGRHLAGALVRIPYEEVAT